MRDENISEQGSEIRRREWDKKYKSHSDTTGDDTTGDDTTSDDTPRDARRAEHDAKRDMLDAEKQDAYDAKANTRHGTTCLFSLLTLACDPNYDEQETTED